jgi:hypothetical protein
VADEDHVLIDRRQLLLDPIPPGLVVRIVSIGHLWGDDAIISAERAGQVDRKLATTLRRVQSSGALNEQDRLGVHIVIFRPKTPQRVLGCQAGCPSKPGLSVSGRVVPVARSTVKTSHDPAASE